MISSVDLAHYGVFRAKDRVSMDCGAITYTETRIYDTSDRVLI